MIGLPHHPHLVRLKESFMWSIGQDALQGVCIVLPYYPSNLAELVKNSSGGRLTFTKTLECGIQIADGLCAMHDSNYLHRDIKPANILLSS